MKRVSGDKEQLFEEPECNQERGQDEITAKSFFNDHHLTDARVSSSRSIFCSDTDEDPINATEVEHSDIRTCTASHSQTFAGLMKLIAGSLHGAVDCSALHDNLDNDDEPNCSNASSPHSPSTPTLTEVARKAAKSEGMQLDELQHIASETICCTFLLQLINERADADFGLESQPREALASNDDGGSMKLLTKELKVRFSGELNILA